MASEAKGLPDSFIPGDKKSDGSGVDLATTRNVKWTAKLGSQTYGNPTVSGGKVFLGTNDFALGDPRFSSTKGGLVKCLDEATGKPLWQLVVPRLETKDPNFNFDNFDLGVCSSPTVEGDRAYLVTNRCDVLCLDADGMADGNDGPFKDEGQYSAGPGNKPATTAPSDGDIVWRYDMIAESNSWPQDAANSSPLLYGDYLYICTSNGVDRSHDRVPHPLAPSLIVLDKRTGRLVAQDDEKIGTRLFHGQWTSPSLGMVNGKPLIFYGGGDGLVYAFEAVSSVSESPVSLKKVWSFDCNPPEYKYQNGKPVRYRTGDIRIHQGNLNDGRFIGPSEIIATPVFCNNRVYVATGQDPSHGRGRGMLSCVDATRQGDVTKTGKIWTYDKLDRSLSTVSVADGLVYVADMAGRLHCLDADTGQCYWIHETKAEVWGSTFVADGKVYLGTQKSLWILAAGKEKKVLNEIRLGAPVDCTPIVANGVLYVASHRYLWAVQASKP
ncbi:MAG: outer membrane protein assembly factor BamB family protein [Pirellulales bacterium]